MSGDNSAMRLRSMDIMKTVFPKWRMLFVICLVFVFMMASAAYLSLRTFLLDNNSYQEAEKGTSPAPAAAILPPIHRNLSYRTQIHRRRRFINIRAVTEPYRRMLSSPVAKDDEDGDEPQGKSFCKTSPTGVPTSDDPSQVERSMQYCNSMENSNKQHHKEGNVDTGYYVMAVALVMRHGYRSPMYTLPNLAEPKLCCKLSWMERNDSLLQRFLNSTQSILARKQSPAALVFRRFGIYPNSDNCYGAQLTALGTLQMLRLGQYFRSRYVGGSKLLPKTEIDFASKIYVRTTEYSRAFQSAAAFLFGFLSTAEFGSAQIETTKSLFLCPEGSANLNLTCSCPTANRLAKSLDGAWKTGNDDRQLRLALERIFNVTSGRLPNNGVFQEVFMSHVCHGLGLPCPESPGTTQVTRDCVTWHLVNEIWRNLDASGQERLQIDDNNQLNRLLSYPLLYEIAQNFIALASGKLKRVFYLYSGHDKTISAIVNGLGVGDGLWPPFGARVVFELLQHRVSKNRFFVRLLYEGNDVTGRIPELAGNSSETGGLIPLEDFSDFLLNRSSRTFWKSSYKNICG